MIACEYQDIPLPASAYPVYVLQRAGNGRGGIFSHGFGDQYQPSSILGVQSRAVFHYRIYMVPARHDNHAAFAGPGGNGQRPVKGGSEKAGADFRPLFAGSGAFVRQTEELLGAPRMACGPKSRSRSPGHDYAIIKHCFNYKLQITV
jgi:hypothetical protein